MKCLIDAKPEYNYFTTVEGNLVWAGAMNLAFIEFKRKFLRNKDLKFSDD